MPKTRYTRHSRRSALQAAASFAPGGRVKEPRTRKLLCLRHRPQRRAEHRAEQAQAMPMKNASAQTGGVMPRRA